MSNVSKNVDWNKLRAFLSGKMLQTVECTNNIDVDLDWECWLQCYDDAVKTRVPKISVRRTNLTPLSEVRRLKQ